MAGGSVPSGAERATGQVGSRPAGRLRRALKQALLSVVGLWALWAVPANLFLWSDCRDARPIVGLYVRRQHLPGFLAGLFALDPLAVKASMLASRASVALRGLDARGLSLALGVEGQHKSFRLLKPGSYFADAQRALQPDRQLAALPRARRLPRKRRAAVVQGAD